MRPRRLSVVLAAALAAFACSSAAFAAGHPHTISGRVLSINVQAHTLRLRVDRGARARSAAAHAAAAGGRVVVIAFGTASVSGPDGAVAVGDEVSVTTSDANGQGAVATSIQVIGQPNGGAAGKGAAVPGVVSAVDAADGQLTLAVMSTDGQDRSQPSSVIVTVDAATILAVGDTNHDGAITLADVSVGDHIVVFTEDATADPLAAVGILDASNAGGNHQDQEGDGPRRTAIPGTVVSVDVQRSTLVIAPFSDGAPAAQQLTVTVTPQTSFGGEAGDGGSFGLGDINQGDHVVVWASGAPANGEVVALGVVDRSTIGSGTPAPAPTTAAPGSIRFGGTVTEVRADGITVEVTSDGPLDGQSVIVAIRPTTSLATGQGRSTGAAGLTAINVGDRVEVFTADETANPVVALGVVDDSVVTGSQQQGGQDGSGQQGGAGQQQDGGGEGAAD